MKIYGAKRQKQSSNKPYIQKDTASSTNSYQALYGLSEGEIYGLVDGGKSIRLDGTPIINDNGEPNFPDVSWDFRAGSIDQTHIKGFSSVENEQSVNVELRHDRPYTKAINNKQLSAVAIRLGFNALREQKDNGDVVGYRIEYAIDVQTDGGAWEMVLNTAVDDKVSQGYQRSHRIDLPKAQQGWSVRVRRLTPNRDSEMVSDTMVVSAVTEIIDAKLRYPCTALLALKYDAQTFSNIAKVAVHVRGMLIQVPTNYDPTARTYDGLWDGTFKLAYTNNPAWVFYDICTAKRYGLGDRLAGKVDKWSLYRLAQYCDEMVDDGKGGKEPRFTVNVYLQKADDAYRVLQNLASVFRALSFWDGTSIVVDADTPKEPVYVFSNANVIGGEFSYTGTRARDRHTIVKCAYDDPDNNFETDYIYVQDEHAIAKYGINQLELNLFGCTSKGQAQRAGIWALKSEQLETETVSFSTGLDGFIPKVGEIIHVQDNSRAGRMQAGRIVATDGRQITLDRMAGKVGDTLMVGDNSAQIVQIDDTVITTDTAIGRAGQVFAISSSDVAPRAYRVMTISQNDDASFSFTALQYEIGKFTATNNIAAIPKKEVSVIKAHVLTPPNSVGITERTRTHQGQAITTLVISWEQVVGAVAYIVEYKKDSNAWQTHKVSSHSLEIDGVYAGAYQAKVRAIDAFDNESLATSSQLTQITGKQGKPPRPINLSVQGILFGMNLGWNFARGSDDTNYTEIEVSPDGRSNIATLGTFAYPTNKHEITGLQGNLTQFYRARIVDKLGNTSDWTDWVSGTTSANADKVLDILSGQISQSHLDQSLRTPIGKIGTIESNISGINSKIPTIESNINSFNSKIPSINKIPTLESAINSVNSKIPSIESSISGINRKIPTIESNISGINSKIPTIESNISSVSTRADTINSTLTDANNRLNEAVQSITNIDTRTQWQTRGATSLNSLVEQGKYYLESIWNTDTPLTGWQYATVDKARNGDRITQTVWNDSTKTYTRTKTGGSWSDWVENVDKTQLDSTANRLTQSIEQTSSRIRDELATKASMDSVTGAIRDINALQTANNAKTAELANLTQTVGGHTSSVRDLGVTTGDLSQKYSQLKAASDTANSEITAIKQTQSGQATSVERLRSELSNKASRADLELSQQTLTTADQALSQRISVLQSNYSDNKSTVENALSTLSQADRTQAEHINQLKSEIYSPNLLQNGDTPKTSSEWNIDFPITESLQAGTRVYVSLGGANGLTSVAVYNSDVVGAAKIGDLTNENGVWKGEFDWVSFGNNNELRFYREPRSSAQTVTASLTTTNGSKIANLERTLTTTNQSLGERINTVQTTASGNTSSINTLNQSLTTANRALGERIDNLNASFTTANGTANNAKRVADDALSRANSANSAITTEQRARADGDSSLSSRITALDASYKRADADMTARIAREETARADGDRANAQAVSNLQTTVNGNTSSINTLNQSLTTKEQALTTQINTAKSELGGRITQISNETRTLTDANRAIGERINRLDSELAGADSISDNLLINSNRTLITGAYLIATYRISETLKNGDKVRLTVNAPQIGINRTGFMAYNSNSAGGSKLADITRSQNGAYTAEFEWNVGTGGNNELWLYHDSSSTRSISTITSVSLQKITTGSGLAGIKSSVANLERTLTTTNQSLSERINTAQTTVNGQAASIQQHAQTLNGLSAQWTLKVQSGGVVSGIGLASNNGISDFAVRADKFYVANPQGNKKPMFSVITRPTTLNGTTVPTGVYLNGDLIASGTISGDKIRANTQITAPNIRGGSINIGSNFNVDSQGNLTANSGVFRGQVFADKITGQIDVESLKSSAVALGYDTYISDNYHASEPHQFDKTFKASYPSHGSITQSLGFNNENIGSIMYEMRVFCKRAITVKQKLHTVDDKLYCYVNGSSAFGYHSVHNGYDDEDEIPLPFGRGRINTEISLSLRQGLNTIQFVLNNSGGGICQVILIGDFIDNNIIKFA